MLVVVGVHSPKFAHEATVEAVDAAVARHGVRHPVLDDPELVTWRAYAARAWPTLVVVDPAGYVVASLAGEGHAHGLRVLLRELVAEHEAAGRLHRGAGPFVPPTPTASALSYPGAVLALPATAEAPGGRLLVADTAHHQLVEVDAASVDAEVGRELHELRRIGSGQRGATDGPASAASFTEPAGMALLPPDVAARVGVDVVLADAAGHTVRGLRLADGAVVTLAGTGAQLRRREGGGSALQQDLSTPTAVAWFDGQVVVAMAGTHQLWALELAPDPADGVVRVIAGTTAEGVRDGAGEQAWFAQTSGLATSPDGEVLWLVDAETSALRWLRRAGGADRSVPVVDDARMANEAPVARAGYEVGTVVGTGLFDFGHRDGDAAQALLQHPLGLALLPDGSVAVADTYNGAVRRYEPTAAGGVVTTLATGLAEPAGLVVEDGGATLLVVESSAHRLVRLPVPATAQRVEGTALHVARPPTDVAPGPLQLEVVFTPPAGQALDDRWGDPTRLVVSATPPELLAAGAGDAPGLARPLVLAEGVPAGVLHVSAQAAACAAHGADGAIPEHAACHFHQQDWGIPVRVVEGAASTLSLDLRGA